MRILHVVAGVSPRAGGPTAAVWGMCAGLRASGIDVAVATTDADPSGGRWIPDGPFPVPTYCFGSPALRRFGFSPELARWLRGNVHDWDIVHVHGLIAHSSLAAAAAARHRRIPYVLRPSGELGPWPLRKTRRLKQLFLAVSGWRVVDGAAVVHVMSRGEQAALTRLRPSVSTALVPLGIEMPRPNVPRGRFRARHGEILRNRKLVASICRIDPIKGLDLLVEAIARLSRDDVALVLAGAGSPEHEAALRGQVQKLGLADRVLFCGHLDGSDRAALLADAELFVLPSHHENFGLAVVEAMADGVPVVISDQVGIEAEVRRAQAGIVTRCDAAEVADGLKKLLESQGLRREMGERGRALVEREFSWPYVAKQLVELYRSVLDGRGRVDPGGRRG